MNFQWLSLKSLAQGWGVMVKSIAWLFSVFCTVANVNQRRSNAQATDIHFDVSTSCKVQHQSTIRSAWKWGLRLPLFNSGLDTASFSVWERHYFLCGRRWEQPKALLRILCIAAFILSWWCRPHDQMSLIRHFQHFWLDIQLPTHEFGVMNTWKVYDTIWHCIKRNCSCLYHQNGTWDNAYIFNLKIL